MAERDSNKPDTEPDTKKGLAPEVEAEIVDAEFEDQPAGEASEPDSDHIETPKRASDGLLHRLRRLSPGVLLFLAFIVISLAAFAVWRMQSGAPETKIESPLEQPEKTAPSSDDLSRSASEDASEETAQPKIETAPGKIVNSIDGEAKHGAAAIAAGDEGKGRGLPPPPPPGSANDELQKAAKEAARNLAADDGDAIDSPPENQGDGFSFETEDNGGADAAPEPQKSEISESAEEAAAAPASSALGVDRAEFEKLAADLAKERSRSQQQAQEIASLRQNLLEVSAQRDGAAEAELSTLRARLDRLESDAEAVPEERKAAASLALISLSRAVDAGGAYASELDSMERIAPDLSAIERLRTNARDGLPTLAELKTSFAPAARAALAAAARENADGPAARIFAKFQNVVAVRPAHPGDRSTPAAIISHAENNLVHERLGAAVEELESLDGAAADAVSPWLEEARDRLAADNALGAMTTALLSDYRN